MIFLLAITVCTLGVASAEEIRIEGGAAAISTVFAPIKEAYEKASGDTVKVTTTNPAKALVSLEKGHIDLAALTSLWLNDAIAKAKNEGVLIDPKTLVMTEIASSRLVIFLHKTNHANQLTKEQLKGIYTGKITNWREVGGENRPIEVYWSEGTPILNNIFN